MIRQILVVYTKKDEHGNQVIGNTWGNVLIDDTPDIGAPMVETLVKRMMEQIKVSLPEGAVITNIVDLGAIVADHG